MGEEAATLVKGPGVLRMALHCDRGWRLRDQYSDGGGGGSTGSLMQVGPDFGGSVFHSSRKREASLSSRVLPCTRGVVCGSQPSPRDGDSGSSSLMQILLKLRVGEQKESNYWGPTEGVCVVNTGFLSFFYL